MLLDIIFSLDSVITAVGLSDHLFIMMAAVVIAVGVMMFAARPIGEFVDRHPSVKMLALSFLILVGFTLILESFDVHVPKGYIYFAMFFSIAVESLNLLRNKRIRCNPRLAPPPGSEYSLYFLSSHRLRFCCFRHAELRVITRLLSDI